MERLTGATELDPDTEGARMQNVSADYWRRSTNTYLGSSTYYDHKGQKLEQLLASLDPIDSAVDLGCGDGRYTLQIAGHAKQVEGRDISQALIAAANERARHAGVTNTRFVVAEGADELPAGNFGLVAALGVTSCIVDDAAFRRFLDGMAAACRVGGHLVLVDSLSRQGDALNRFASGYVARYRPVDVYRSAVQTAGFELREEHDLGTPATNPLVRLLPIRRRTNRLFHFARI